MSAAASRNNKSASLVPLNDRTVIDALRLSQDYLSGTTRSLKKFQRSRSLKIATEAFIIVAAAWVYVAPPSPNWVEAHYSRTLYPRVQRSLTSLSNRFPFALCDALVLLLAIGLIWWWLSRLKAAGRGRRLRTTGPLTFHTLALAGLALILFQIVWGLNYSRVPLIEKLDYDTARVTDQSISDIAKSCVTRLNASSSEVHSAPWPDLDRWSQLLEPSFESVVSDLGVAGGIVPGRIKHSLSNPYLAASGIEGFIDPYGLESILNNKILPVEQPFAMAHEWAHLAGFADESEANFIALLTCLRSTDANVQYAGWLALYPELPATAVHGDQPGNELRLDPRVVADLEDIYRQREKYIRPWVNAAQWRFYDRFLKANHVQAGVASYGLFLRLLAGTRFGVNWAPAMRTST